MASGRLDLSIYGGNSVYIKWETVSQTGMTTRVYWEAYQVGGYHGVSCSIRGYIYTPDYSPGGNSVTSVECLSLERIGGVIVGNATKKISSGYVDVSRSINSNKGQLSIQLTHSAGSTIVPNYEKPTSFSASTINDTWTIDTTTTYGAAAQITSVTDFTDETSPTITYSYDKGTQVTLVELYAGISFTGSQMDIPYREISATETSYTFNFTADETETLYTLLKSGSTNTVRFVIRTVEDVNGEVMIQEKSYLKVFSFVNYTPLLQPEVWDTNTATIAVTNNNKCIVKHMSNVNYDMNVTLRKGALDVIGSYVSNGGHIVEGFTEGNYGTPTSNIFYFSATDDRGYTGTADVDLSLFYGEFIDYVKLTNNTKCSPISGQGELDITVSGKYFKAQFGPDGQTNKLYLRYKVYTNSAADTATWTDPIEIVDPEMLDNTTFTYSFRVTGLDYTKQYTVETRVLDLLMSTDARTSVVAKPIFYWNNDEFNFNVPVNIMGTRVELNSADYVEEEATVDGYYMNSSGSYTAGSYTWNYKKWSSGLLECWCTVPLSTTVNTTWGNMYVASTTNAYKTDLAYPVQPKGTPLVIASLGAGSTKGMLIADNSYAADNISTGRYNIASPVSITSSTTFRINYYVRGKWK